MLNMNIETLHTLFLLIFKVFRISFLLIKHVVVNLWIDDLILLILYLFIRYLRFFIRITKNKSEVPGDRINFFF